MCIRDRYPSSLLSCHVTRVSRNVWTKEGTTQHLCFKAGTDGYEASFVDFDDDSGACEANYTIAELKEKSHDESYKWVPTDDNGVAFQNVDAGVFSGTDDDTVVGTNVQFRTATPCSSQGDCDVGTGQCQCATGFHGAACEILDVNVFV